MAIGDQFSGLDMKNLIGAPLSAASDASVELANSTADFINKVGFDKSGKVRTAAFKFNQVSKNEDGSTENQELNVDVPLLAITPIPNLQIDEVNILFDMEVKQSQRSESASDYGGSFTGKANFGIVKVSVSGSVSAHSSNTRSTDNSAKYHVDVSATNHGTPEGLARVLDMMAANISPTLVSSTSVDESGKPLVGERKSKMDTLKQLRLQKSQLETAYSSAEKAFDTTLDDVKREAMNKQNSLTLSLQSKINELDEDKGNANYIAYTNANQELTESWRDFQNTAKDRITAAASSGTDMSLTSVFILKGLTTDYKTKKYAPEDESESGELSLLSKDFKKSVEAYKTVLKAKEQLNTVDLKYNEAIYNTALVTDNKEQEKA